MIRDYHGASPISEAQDIDDDRAHERIILAAIEKAEAAQWISVEDGLPNIAQEVLFFGPTLDVTLGNYLPNHSANYPWAENGSNDAFQPHHVSHWCPLPPPLEGE